MTHTEVKAEIIHILINCGQSDIVDESEVLFSPYYTFQASDMAYLIISLHKKYRIDVRGIISGIRRYSVDGIANAVISLLENDEK